MSSLNGGLVRQIKRFRPVVKVAKSTMRCLSLPIRPILVSRYLKTHAVRKLQIGAHVCVLPGWLNTDLYPLSISAVALDATKTFPLPDASFDYVFSEHQLEHIDYSGALNMLKECRRILRPGGKIRLAVPSLDRLVELIQATRTEVQDRYIRYSTDFWWPSVQNPGPCFAFNSAFMNWGHKFLYDQATLRNALETSGFTRTQFFAPGVSDDPNLTGIEVRVSEMDVYETLVVQAMRG
jgi:predicted SAM-dependent methyltransferase